MAQTVTRPKAQGYGVLIDSDHFRVAPSSEVPLTMFTRDSLARRQDEQHPVSGGHNVLEIGHGYSRNNYTGGEGLDWWPREIGETPADTDLIRYWDSENIDIRRPKAGQPYQLTLVKDVATFWTPAGTPTDMGTSKDRIYVIEGTNVHRFDDWADTTAEDTDNIAVTLVQLAVGPDNSVAVLDNAGDIWFKGSQTETYLKVYDSTVDGDDAKAIWWVKDRIIFATNDTTAATQGAMREGTPAIGGTPAVPTEAATFATIDTFEGEMYACVDAGHAIVAGFSDGSIRSYVPQTDTAGGTPALTIRARVQMPTGEVPVALGWNLGHLLILTLADTPSGSDTTARLYSAVVLDERFDYAVGDMQLLRVWENSAETAPAYTKNFTSTRDEIFFAIGEAASTYNIWRYDLVTRGLFRHAAVERTEIEGLVYHDERLAFIDTADVVLQSTTDFMADGYLITPNITFGLNTPINWTSFILEAENLDVPGVKVEYFASTDSSAILDPTDPNWVIVETYTDPAQTGLEKAVIKTQSNQLALQVKLTRSTALTTAPNVTRFAVRGLPAHRDWVCDVPINISDIVTAPGRMPIRVPGQGDSEHIKVLGLQGKSTTLKVYDPPATFRGIVESIAEPTTFITDRGSQGRYCLVRFLGILVGTDPLSAVQGNAGMGITTMGIGTMGIGQT